MKKVLILAAAALVVLVSCKKEETKFVESASSEISFKAVASPVTKAGELAGTAMEGKGYVIYASATQYNSNGVLENAKFFTDQPFQNTEASNWHHVNAEAAAPVADPIYWPVGGARMDFLAYALPVGAKATIPAPAFNADLSAKDFTVASWDTYATQVDLLYSAANGQTSKANGTSPYVKMLFKHAQALLIFNVKVNDAAANLTINNISFVEDPKAATKVGTLVTEGTFTVDNSRNDLKASWELSAAGADFTMPLTAITAPSECNLAAVTKVENYGTALSETEYAQLGETLLIPEQARQNFTVNYTVGANTMDYTYNIERGNWEMGKKYIYNLDVTVNEIIITEEVADFEEVTDNITIE